MHNNNWQRQHLIANREELIKSAIAEEKIKASKTKLVQDQIRHSILVTLLLQKVSFPYSHQFQLQITHTRVQTSIT